MDETDAAPSTLRVEFPTPDANAIKSLTALLKVETPTTGITGGTSTLTASYPSEAEAREAMGKVRSEHPVARCSIEPS